MSKAQGSKTTNLPADSGNPLARLSFFLDGTARSAELLASLRCVCKVEVEPSPNAGHNVLDGIASLRFGMHNAKANPLQTKDIPLW